MICVKAQNIHTNTKCDFTMKLSKFYSFGETQSQIIVCSCLTFFLLWVKLFAVYATSARKSGRVELLPNLMSAKILRNHFWMVLFSYFWISDCWRAKISLVLDTSAPCFYRTRVRSLFTLVTIELTDPLTHWLLFCKLDWCHPGVWRSGTGG